MKIRIAFLAAALSIVCAGSALADTVTSDMAYQNWYGYRDWQSYGGHMDVGTYWLGYVKCAEEVAIKYTAATDVTFNQVRIWTKGGGGGAADAVECYVTANQQIANYWASKGVTYAKDAQYLGAWDVPDESTVLGVGSAETWTGGAAAVTHTFATPITITAGTTFHIRFSIDADVVDPTMANNKLRLYTSGASASTHDNGDTNYRNADGAPLNDGTAPTTAPNGTDKMSMMLQPGYWSLADWSNFPTVNDYWAEGDFYNNGQIDYSKTTQPLFELLIDDDPTGVGQGTVPGQAVQLITIDGTERGQVFAAPSSLPITDIGMRINGAGATDIVLSLYDDATNTLLGSGTVAAASVVSTEFATVNIGSVAVTQGQMLRVVATCAGTGFKLYQQKFVGAALGGVSNEASFQGVTGYSTELATADINFIVYQVPEPATMGLLVIGGLGVLLRKRR